MKPRPLILIDTGIIGGPGRGIIQLATFLEKMREEYLVCTFAYRTPKSTEFESELRRLSLHAASISQSGTFDPSPVWQFIRMAKLGKYNIIQSHGYKSHLVALVASRVLNIPWVACTHGATRENRRVALYHALDTVTLRFAEAVVAVSHPLRERFAAQRGAPRPTHLIFNAVEREGLVGEAGGARTRRRFITNDSQILIGCFGRLSFEKGQDLLLRALVEVELNKIDLRLLLLGDGPERETLQQLSKALGLADRVFFHPHSGAMRDFYEAIDLLVLPSRSEGLPNVVLEALCLRVPVVATNVGSVSDVIVDGETGWIVRPDDPHALAQRIVSVLSDREARERVADAGEKVVNERFSPATRGERILEVYRSVLGEPWITENCRDLDAGG